MALTHECLCEQVLIWSAASASCALPGLFAPVELVCKNAKGEHVPYHISNVTWTDGSLSSDLPTARLQVGVLSKHVWSVVVLTVFVCVCVCVFGIQCMLTGDSLGNQFVFCAPAFSFVNILVCVLYVFLCMRMRGLSTSGH
jgi:hypothetical protein